MKTKKDRSHRLSKKLHKKYLSDTRLYICSSEEWLDTLKQANDGQIFYIKNNEKTPTLKKITDKNLNYQVTKISTKPDQSFDIEISPCKFRELILRSTIFPPNSDSAIEAIRLAEQRTLSEKNSLQLNTNTLTPLKLCPYYLTQSLFTPEEYLDHKQPEAATDSTAYPVQNVIKIKPPH